MKLSSIIVVLAALAVANAGSVDPNARDKKITITTTVGDVEDAWQQLVAPISEKPDKLAAEPDPEKSCPYGLEIGPDMTGIIPPTKLSGNKADFVASNPENHPQRLAKYPEARIHAQVCIAPHCGGGDQGQFPTGDYWLTLGLPYGSASAEDKAKAAGKWSIWTAGKTAPNKPVELPTDVDAKIKLYATCEGCPGTGGVFGTYATWTNVLDGAVNASKAECCTKKCPNCEPKHCDGRNLASCLLTTCCKFNAAVGCTCQDTADACGPSGH